MSSLSRCKRKTAFGFERTELDVVFDQTANQHRASSASRLHARTPPRHAVERIRHQPSPPDQPERRRSVTANWRMNGTNALMERPQTDLMLRASNVNRLIGRSKSGNAFLFREEIASSPPITFNHHPGIRKQGKGGSQKSSTHPHPHSHNPHPRRQGMWAGWAELRCVCVSVFCL